MRKTAEKYDLILIIILLFAALVIWLSFSLKSSEKAYAIIECGGKELQKIDLSDIENELSFSVEGKNGICAEIIAEKGKIRFASASCADLICVRTGWISKKGQTAVCLPAEICVYIVGGEGAADAVTG